MTLTFAGVPLLPPQVQRGMSNNARVCLRGILCVCANAACGYGRVN
jgi:hypothetical protein